MLDSDKIINVEVVHAKIMGRAQELANQRWFEHAGTVEMPARYRAGERFKAPPGKRYQLGSSGTVFRYDAAQTKRGGLTLSLEENFDATLTEEQRQYAWQVGAQAIEDSLMEHQEEWVAGILQDALSGTNYFDRFIAAGEQSRLF
jgi:hypothetical protein